MSDLGNLVRIAVILSYERGNGSGADSRVQVIDADPCIAQTLRLAEETLRPATETFTATGCRAALRKMVSE
ncbi:hypothetical protein V5799_010964 [Amblyomma americanum]|uniref:Uncharacterized protein n=1 Tax=Amblyomma americanum TaxID=6943 RepID=A0AAQ4EIQ8_AMBAM